ncbi:MAG: radical SAM protein [Myxococcota bacterium]
MEACVQERAKFSHPRVTAKGEMRATVPMVRLETLWFNTGTRCNLSCAHCYIESTPHNDRLVYITRDEVLPYLEEAKSMGTREIGLTGGEPFMNPHLLGIIEDAIEREFEVLVLTNATRPMMRKRIQEDLLALRERAGDKLTLRVSLDHFTEELHDAERGANAFAQAREGLQWLSSNGFNLAVAGRTMWGETEENSRSGYAATLNDMGIELDVSDRKKLVLFSEMRENDDPPEITTACWGILDKSPTQIMCSSSRMVVKRKGAEHPVVLSCTLLAYDERFEMGRTLAEASTAVSLNHPWCATFCVLGGSSCS